MVIVLRGLLTGPLVTNGFASAASTGGSAELRPALATIMGDLVTAGGPLYTAAAGEVYFGASPQSSQLPTVNYRISDRTYGRNISGSNAVSTAECQITVVALLESDADAIAQSLRNRLDGFSGTAGGLEILACFLDGESDDPHPPKSGSTRWLYIIELTFTIKHRVSLPSNLEG